MKIISFRVSQSDLFLPRDFFSIDQDLGELRQTAFTNSSPLSKDKGEFNSQSIDRAFSPRSLSTRRSIEENQSFTYLRGGKLFLLLLLLLRFEVMDGSLPPSLERVYHEARVWDGEGGGGKEGRAR